MASRKALSISVGVAAPKGLGECRIAPSTLQSKETLQACRINVTFLNRKPGEPDTDRPIAQLERVRSIVGVSGIPPSNTAIPTSRHPRLVFQLLGVRTGDRRSWRIRLRGETSRRSGIKTRSRRKKRSKIELDLALQRKAMIT